jgi:hypothetical protein
MSSGHNAINGLGVSKYVVSSDPTQGNYTSIAAVNLVAASGDQVYIRAGTYNESNSSWVPGVQYFAGGNSGATSIALGTTPAVIIKGNQTFSAAGNYYLTGLYFTATSGNVITLSGASAINLNMLNCYLYAGSGSSFGFTFTNSSANSAIVFLYGLLDIASGAAYYSSTALGSLSIFYSTGLNSGASTTAATNSAGVVGWYFSQVYGPLSTSSTGVLNTVESNINCAALNTTAMTLAGTGGSGSNYSSFLSGTAAAISVGLGCTLGLDRARINSSNASPIANAGTLNYSPATFTGTASISGAGTSTPLQIGPTIYTTGITFTNQALGTGNVITNYVEELSYTPALSGSTTTGSPTYTNRIGYYTQIGKRVFLEFLIQYTGVGSAAGTLQVSLPITARNSTFHYFLGSVQFQNITTPTGNFVSQIAPGASVMTFVSSTSGSTGSSIAAGAPTGQGLLLGSISYLVV